MDPARGQHGHIEMIAARNRALAEQRRKLQDERESLGICSWHEGQTESAAMWSSYAQRGMGVAIKSIVGRLRRSLVASGVEVEIYWVQYTDDDLLIEANPYHPFLIKRTPFAYEREIRALVRLTDVAMAANEPGRSVPISVEELTEEIVLAPRTPKAYPEAVKQAVNRSNHIQLIDRDCIRNSVLTPWQPQ
jgi:hypothetical protein